MKMAKFFAHIEVEKLSPEQLLDIVQSVLGGKESLSLSDEEWEEVFYRMQQHAISCLMMDRLSKMDIPQKWKERWKQEIIQHVIRNQRVRNAEAMVLKQFEAHDIIAYVLKGTAIAQYYGNIDCRILGDIDLLIDPENLGKAEALMISDGWKKLDNETNAERHVEFQKKGINLELHFRFAIEKVITDIQRFDHILFDQMKVGGHWFSDDVNGLIALEHFAQHMRKGIGLRHLLDWMMFVNSCLDDQTWHRRFQPLCVSFGLETLAMTLTKACQLYLGLPKDRVTWCMAANDELCAEVMHYVVECGNFGRSRSAMAAGSVPVLTDWRHPLRWLRYVQKRGERNWHALKNHPVLKPLAVFYQLGCYLRVIKRNDAGLFGIKGVFSIGKRRRDMFQQLGLLNLKE